MSRLSRTQRKAEALIDDFPRDPRVQRLVDSLTDDQVAECLLLDQDLVPPEQQASLLGEPATNRRNLIDRFEQATVMGDADHEMGRLESFAASARDSFPAP